MTHSGGFGEIRAGDPERQQGIAALTEHHAQGRLSLSEYDERVAQVAGAGTYREIAEVFADLPGPHPQFLLPPMPAAPPPMGPQQVALLPGGMYSDKSKIVAGVLQILLPLGIGRFYTGHVAIAVIQLLLFLGGLITCGVSTTAGAIWCLIDGIVLLATDSTDANGRYLRR